MLSDISSKSIKTQGKFTSLKENKSISAVSDFIKSNLHLFSEQNKNSTLPENSLTQRLTRLLNSICIRENKNFPFYFDKEDIQDETSGMSPSIDIGTITTEKDGVLIGAKLFTSQESFFSIEAKKLDTTVQAHRKKEYLVGYYDNAAAKYRDTGAIERYKKQIHGKTLCSAGIIAYIINEDIPFWKNKIDKWLDELISESPVNNVCWEDQDKLSVIEEDSIKAVFQSQNSRENDHIRLIHYWVIIK